MITLAQWNPNIVPPAPLPEVGWLESVTLESPWPGVALLGLMVVGAIFVLNRAGQLRLGLMVGGVLLLLAGGLVASAHWVFTDREAVRARTREVVAALARGDAAAAERDLLASVSLTLPGNRTGLSKADIVSRVDRYMNGAYALKDKLANITTLRAVVDGPGIARTQTRVTAEHAATGYPAATWWLIGWRRGDDGAWRVSSMELQQLEGAPSGLRYAP